jgi:hypothetical protein
LKRTNQTSILAGLCLLAAVAGVPQTLHAQAGRPLRKSDPLGFCDAFNSSAHFSIFGDQGFQKKAKLIPPVTQEIGFVELTAADRQRLPLGIPVVTRSRSVAETGGREAMTKFLRARTQGEIPFFVQAGIELLGLVKVIEESIVSALSAGLTALEAAESADSSQKAQAAILAELLVDGGQFVEVAVRQKTDDGEFLDQSLAYAVTVGSESKVYFLCSLRAQAH